MALEDVAARFRARLLRKEEWTHAAHLAVGAWHVHTFGPEEAIERLRIGIRSLNERHGTANTDTGGYHETITIAHVRLIDQFLSGSDPTVSISRRVQTLIYGPLSDKALLLRFWSRACLMSAAARAAWIPPDLMPLTLPPNALIAHRRDLPAIGSKPGPGVR